MSDKVGLFSGGKDSYTACKVSNVKEVVYCKTGVGLNFDYVLKICEREGWKLNVVYPKKGETFEDFVRRFKFPHTGMHNGDNMAFIQQREQFSKRLVLKILPSFVSN